MWAGRWVDHRWCVDGHRLPIDGRSLPGDGGPQVNETDVSSIRTPRRAAILSVHTSPLHQPGTGDAGGMNVYIIEVARRLARADVEVEIFTRATSPELPPTVEVAPAYK
jgi:hypothetical protein